MHEVCEALRASLIADSEAALARFGSRVKVTYFFCGRTERHSCVSYFGHVVWRLGRLHVRGKSPPHHRLAHDALLAQVLIVVVFCFVLIDTVTTAKKKIAKKLD